MDYTEITPGMNVMFQAPPFCGDLIPADAFITTVIGGPWNFRGTWVVQISDFNAYIPCENLKPLDPQEILAPYYVLDSDANEAFGPFDAEWKARIASHHSGRTNTILISDLYFSTHEGKIKNPPILPVASILRRTPK